MTSALDMSFRRMWMCASDDLGYFLKRIWKRTGTSLRVNCLTRCFTVPARLLRLIADSILNLKLFSLHNWIGTHPIFPQTFPSLRFFHHDELISIFLHHVSVSGAKKNRSKCLHKSIHHSRHCRSTLNSSNSMGESFIALSLASLFKRRQKETRIINKLMCNEIQTSGGN